MASFPVLLLLVANMLTFSNRQSAAPDTISQVIENLRSNEELYEHIELVIETRYNVPNEIDPKAIQSEKRDHRLVLQKGNYYSESTRNIKTGEELSFRVVAGYDGESTRRYQLQSGNSKGAPNARLGQVVEGLAWEKNVVPLHSLILDTLDVNFRLSTFLRGPGAIRSEKRSVRKSHEFPIEVTACRESELDGLHCWRIDVSRYHPGSDRANGEFHSIWLATERNYFPIRHVASLPSRYKTNDPYEVGECLDFVELKPGLWIPKKVSIQLFDYNELILTGSFSRGAPRIHSTTDFFIQKCLPFPNYDKSFFSNIKFPEGTFVQEMSNGKTLRSYTVPIQSSTSSIGRIVLVVAYFLVPIGLIFLVLLRRRYRR